MTAHINTPSVLNSTVETAKEEKSMNVRAMSLPRILLHIEGLAVFVAAIATYANLGGNWLVFIALLLTPDLAMLAYFLNPRWGSISYNLFHTYTFPLALFALGLLTGNTGVAQIAAIWLAHIGMDRTVGYGLKYSTGFKDTHLQRI
jgi:hypothetical protein